MNLKALETYEGDFPCRRKHIRRGKKIISKKGNDRNAQYILHFFYPPMVCLLRLKLIDIYSSIVDEITEIGQ